MYKGRIVNFELLYVDGEFIDDESLANVTYNMVMADIVRAADQGFNVIVGLLLMDGFLYKDNEIFYRNLKRIQKQAFKFGIKKIMLVTGMCEDFQHHLASKGLNYEIVFFDFTHHMVYQSYLGKEDLLPKWNYNSKKFLFLGGVPSRKNRINLLSKFYDKKLLDCAEWSFFRPWTTEDQWWCRAALDYYTDEQYEQFLNDCDRAIDHRYQEAKNYSRLPGKDLKETNVHDTDWCKDPSWIDPSVFDNTLFSIISEGNAYPPATDFRFLTEKTWRTIIMKHPFVFAGEPEQFHYAKSKGLKTFENYMLIDDYADITYEDHRLDAVVKNTERFLIDAENNIDQIQQDIEHNFQIFLDVAKYNQSLLDHLQDDYNVDPDEIERWFNHKSFVHLIRIANGN